MSYKHTPFLKLYRNKVKQDRSLLVDDIAGARPKKNTWERRPDYNDINSEWMQMSNPSLGVRRARPGDPQLDHYNRMIASLPGGVEKFDDYMRMSRGGRMSREVSPHVAMANETENYRKEEGQVEQTRESNRLPELKRSGSTPKATDQNKSYDQNSHQRAREQGYNEEMSRSKPFFIKSHAGVAEYLGMKRESLPNQNYINRFKSPQHSRDHMLNTSSGSQKEHFEFLGGRKSRPIADPIPITHSKEEKNNFIRNYEEIKPDIERSRVKGHIYRRISPDNPFNLEERMKMPDVHFKNNYFFRKSAYKNNHSVLESRGFHKAHQPLQETEYSAHYVPTS